MIELPPDEQDAEAPTPMHRVVLRAAWYAAIALAIWWLWHTPQADFRYFGL